MKAASKILIGIEPVHAAVGIRIRMLRETLGVTQQDLAKRLDGLDRASLANIETGRQRLQLHTVEKIATALGTNPKHLMKGVWW
jgi:transcriptional regulator with XRE-family HTH domain